MRQNAKPSPATSKPSQAAASPVPGSKPRMPLQEALKRTNERFGKCLRKLGE